MFGYNSLIIMATWPSICSIFVFNILYFHDYNSRMLDINK